MLNFHHSDDFSLQWWIFFTVITFYPRDENLFQLCFITSWIFSYNWRIFDKKIFFDSTYNFSHFIILFSISKLFTIVLFGHRRNSPLSFLVHDCHQLQYLYQQIYKSFSLNLNLNFGWAWPSSASAYPVLCALF